MEKPTKDRATEKASITPTTEISKLESMSTRRFILVMISASVAIVVVGVALLYWLIGRYIEQSNKNKAQDMTIKLLEQKKVDLEALKPNYEKITTPSSDGISNADRILNAVPVDDGFKQLISMVEVMASQSGVGLTNVSKSTTAAQTTAAIAPPPGTKSYNVSIEIEGSFSNILEFMRKTENSSRVMNFVSMSLDGATSAASVGASINFTVYYKGPADIVPTKKELK